MPGIIAGCVAAGVAVAGIPLVATGLGFTAGGIAAGSIAAGLHSASGYQAGSRRVSTGGRGNRGGSSKTANVVSGRGGCPNSRGGGGSIRRGSGCGARRAGFRSNAQPDSLSDLERRLTNSCTISSSGPQPNSDSTVGTTVQQVDTRGLMDFQNGFNASSSQLNERDRKTHPLGLVKLKEYMAGSSIELVLHLTCGQAFELLLNSDSIKLPNKPGIVFEDHILTALAKALDSKLLSVRENQNELISRVLKSSYFRSTLTNQITRWLVNLAAITQRSRPAYFTNINNCCIVLFNLMELRYSATSDCATNVTLLKTLFERMKSGYFDYNIVVVQLVTSHKKMVEKFDELLVCQRGKSSNVMTYKNVLPREDEPPPNDFREISVVPTVSDINEIKCAYLRSNIDKGAYDDVDHYLDVQFRLLREDCIRPIRRGIQALRNTGILLHKYSQDIILYNRTCILSPEITTNGKMAYRIQFDIKQFHRSVKWEVSKRLIFGSLLCLSNDMFETIIFATVFDSNPIELAKGFLLVKFESEFQLADSYSKEYIMAESGAYFEAYRHVLTGLQKMPVDGFPMERYLVHCQTDLRAPVYLRYGRVAMSQLRGINRSSKYEMMKLKTSSSTSVPQQSVMVDVMDPLKWPSNDAFGLDEKQYDALKLAITSEFALIQGPPGTGKTFIGYKIVELLLDNSNVWGDTEIRNICNPIRGVQMKRTQITIESPILILCYTNHALDQFLEGVADFMPEGIIRVGGRCKSEKLNRYLFHEVMRNNKRVLPHFIRRQFYTLRQQKMKIERKIQEAGIQHKMPFRNIMRYDPAQVDVNQNVVVDNFENDVDESTGFEDFDRERYLDDDDFHEDPDEHLETFEQRQARKEAELRNYESMFEAAYCSKLHTHKMASRSGAHDVKKREKYIKQMLSINSHKFYEPDEAITKTDVWGMCQDERWKMYHFWIKSYVTKVSQHLNALQSDQITLQKRLDELRQYEQLQVLQSARIIGMTTTGAAKHHGLLHQLGAKIIIIEEAAEVLEAHIVTGLSSKCEHLILIGDHFQLRPNPTVYELAKKYKLEISLFERMINNGIKCATLALQHRMRPEIADLLMPHFYNGLRNADNVYKYPDVKGMVKNMFFIQHSNNEANQGDTTSHKNDYESKYLVNLCRYLLQQGYLANQITILTPYSGQLSSLKCQMEKIIPKNGVCITSVDSYQGEQNDIILLSLVRSNKEMKIGFMNTKNRVCVALSRAKVGLYVIGNFDLFAEVNKEFWAPLYNDLKKQSVLSNELEICCQMHKEVRVVKCPSDFEKLAPEGGCLKPCDRRLKCGHVCSRKCHPDDVEHANFTCRQKCGHKCARDLHTCSERCCNCKRKGGCPPCRISIKVSVSICGHVTSIACGTPDDEIKCAEPCPNKLACGHKCPNKCGYTCDVKCMEKVEKLRNRCGHLISVICREEPDNQICPFKLKKIWPLCGHENETRCSTDPSVDPCRHKCGVLLECGHPCSGTCYECYQGRLHKQCGQDCDRILICGHICKAKCCMTACPPCEHPYRQECNHSRRRRCQPGKKLQERTCGQLRIPCKQKCGWRCGLATPGRTATHDVVACSKKCDEICDRPLCDMPCPIARPYRKCNHRCPGLCGEKCPPCRRCQPNRFPMDAISSEPYPDDARFLLLPECNHVVEVTTMDKWMKDDDVESTNVQSNEIVVKGCYQCKTPVLTVNRYNQIIKSKLADVEMVKIKMDKNGKDFVQYHADVLVFIRDPLSSTDMVSNETKNMMTLFGKNVEKVRNSLEMARWSNFATIWAEVLINKDLIIGLFPGNDRQTTTVESISSTLPQLGSFLKLWFCFFMGIPASCVNDLIERLFNDCLHGQLDHLTNKLRKILERNTYLSEQYETECFLEVQRFGPITDLVKFCLELILKNRDLNSGSLHRARQNVRGNIRSHTSGPDFQLARGILTYLYGNKPLTYDRFKNVEMALNQLKKRYGLSNLKVTKHDKHELVRAIGLDKGHWLKCRNGHVYAIGECVGSLQEATCPECDNKISGIQSQT